MKNDFSTFSNAVTNGAWPDPELWDKQPPVVRIPAEMDSLLEQALVSAEVTNKENVDVWAERLARGFCQVSE